MNLSGKQSWLPTTAKEMKILGWDQADIILFTGDAYVDHPSFGAAVIGRYLEHAGYKVAIVPQPNWQDDLRDFKKLGQPRLFFGITAGAMDSMVNHYTAAKRLRSDDSYTPGGKAGQRPDYPTQVYTEILKKIFPDVPVVLGGIEASLRRFTHYDFWQDKLQPSILCTSGADILVYGMGEKSIVEIANRLSDGKSVAGLNDIPQTAYLTKYSPEHIPKVELPSHETCMKSKQKFADSYKQFEEETNKGKPATIVQKYEEKYIVANPPWPVPPPEVVDGFYDLPFTRLPHPRYDKKPPIPAYEMIKFSVNMHRGCFGGCSFCAISANQGKLVASRSKESILQEVKKIAEHPDFRGHVTDLGGPSANMYRMAGIDKKLCDTCKRPSCIYPSVCNNLDTSHQPLNEIYADAKKINGIKKITIGSGVRYDLLLQSYNKKAGKAEEKYTENLIRNHISGRLKVAPEHTEDTTLKIMRKPSFSFFREFKEKFKQINARYHLNQQIIPYFISAHPGTALADMKTLYKKTRSEGFRLEQVQLFTPTPMTLSSVIYYSGIDPFTGKKVAVEKSKEGRKNQHEAFFNGDPKHKTQRGR
ncbi:MAG: YgiQ family radical SAM protein [Bacteroidota bacterium]